MTKRDFSSSMGVMRQTQLFTKTRKEAPADEMAKNAQLLIRAGYVHKEMAGVYSLLPLGLMVVQKISQIIRSEMNAIGGMEMQSAAFQKKETWEKTNRWNDDVVDNWFKTNLKGGGELGLAFTHEEPLTAMMKSFVSSYKDLPVYPYDIRSVFRNEARAKSGLMRGREFFWKALYSFSKDEEEHTMFYEKAKIAYKNVFERVGIGASTYMTFASGGSFSKYSHEFQTLSDAGEDIIYVHEEKGIAVNKEVYTDEVLNELGLDKKDLKEHKAIESGNIFSLGTKFSEPLELDYTNEAGEKKFVVMGSYGIGISRLMGVIAEKFSDEKGLVWPESVAPFQIHLLVLGGDEAVIAQAEKLYGQLIKRNIEVLFDDRKSISPGEKFSDADLLGIPYRVVVSTKTIQQDSVEIKKRASADSELVSYDEFIARFTV